MRNDFYEYKDYLAHSSGAWKDHKYIKKIGDTYVYAKDKVTSAASNAAKKVETTASNVAKKVVGGEIKVEHNVSVNGKGVDANFEKNTSTKTEDDSNEAKVKQAKTKANNVLNEAKEVGNSMPMDAKYGAPFSVKISELEEMINSDDASIAEINAAAQDLKKATTEYKAAYEKKHPVKTAVKKVAEKIAHEDDFTEESNLSHSSDMQVLDPIKIIERDLDEVVGKTRLAQLIDAPIAKWSGMIRNWIDQDTANNKKKKQEYEKKLANIEGQIVEYNKENKNVKYVSSDEFFNKTKTANAKHSAVDEFIDRYKGSEF